LSFSIKLKTGIPVVILTIIIITLIGSGVLTLAKTTQHSENLTSWFKENGEILEISHELAELVFPHVRLTMGQDFENNTKTRETIRQKLKKLDELFLDILYEEHLTKEETTNLENINTRMIALKVISNKILALKLPHEHEKGMALLHEFSNNHIRPINNDLYNWYTRDLDRVNSLQETARQETHTYFIVAGLLAALTLFALSLAIWVNNQSIIRPVLKIKQITAKLARGDLKQRIEIDNDDEIGELAQDISNMASSLETINQKLNDAARTDGLTGILNRRACDEILDQHFSSSLRYDLIFSIILLDIDHFKQINDEHGHEAGDIAIKSIATICQQQVRDCDFVFRHGGEEFLILLPNTDKNDSIVAAERIRTKIQNTTIDTGSSALGLTVSLGISSFPEDGLESLQLVRNADNALYKAKEGGRNQTVAFEKPLLI